MQASKIGQPRINDLEVIGAKKFKKLKLSVQKNQFREGGTMPNQRQRKKKAGVNKIKKTQAMRAKEAAAAPRQPRTATGKSIHKASKREKVRDRAGALNRA